jgi:hypothetical protein
MGAARSNSLPWLELLHMPPVLFRRRLQVSGTNRAHYQRTQPFASLIHVSGKPNTHV